MTTLPARAGRRCHYVVNALHSVVYFSPDNEREMSALGITDRSALYFAGRAAALGRVGAGAVTATFHSFSHELVARHVPHIWDVASPEDVLAARLRVADATLRRLLGEEALASAEMAEAAGLALRAAEACERPVRPLYAAHADLPVPHAPHLALWHAATLLREHRGDGHLIALAGSGLDPLEALVSHSATGRGMSTKWLLATRGWSEEELTAARLRLRERGLLDEQDALTDAGAALREEIEEETDRLDAAPYEHLGAEGVGRLTELATAFATTLVENGGYPADLRR
ncbi:SCO6745 family protein [Streptomyces cinnamoneus]|uniref:SCO6745 family protein n=1 Tax=Streptomyces cinnamoneus TaxID=53446 RepID=UPI0037912458